MRMIIFTYNCIITYNGVTNYIFCTMFVQPPHPTPEGSPCPTRVYFLKSQRNVWSHLENCIFFAVSSDFVCCLKWIFLEIFTDLLGFTGFEYKGRGMVPWGGDLPPPDKTQEFWVTFVPQGSKRKVNINIYYILLYRLCHTLFFT